MTRHRFDQVDVFADGAFTGNPLAVVHDADTIPTDRMASMTAWTNLSENAFLLTPTTAEADYRVRIFTPNSELPFAGHPTLGACSAWLAAGGTPHRDGVVVQECGAGLIELRVDRDGAIAFAAPPMRRHEPVDAADLDDALGVLGIDADDVLASHWIDNGPGWMGVLLRSAKHVLDIAPPTVQAERFHVGVAGLYPSGHRDALAVRAFFQDRRGAIREDPVTGSLNAALAQWLLGSGTLQAPYTAAQTTGRVTVEVADGEVWVGGAVDVRVSGVVEIGEPEQLAEQTGT